MRKLITIDCKNRDGEALLAWITSLALLLVVPGAYAQLPVMTPSVVQSGVGKPVARASAPSAGSAIKSEVSAVVPTALAIASVAPAPITPPAYTSALEESNIFDSQRKMWPDKRPPIAPPPPPPPPPAVTDKDLQLYGVVIVGQMKRATVRLGSRYVVLDTQGRGFVTMSEGQSLGDWVLSEIHPTHLVLGSPGGKQTVMFNKKTDRVATPGMQVAQLNSAPVANDAQANNPVSAPATTSSADPNTGRNATGAPNAIATTPQSNAAENTIRSAPPGSLAAAIGAAQAAAAAAQTQNATPPPNFNPFLQLFPKQ